MSSVRLENVSRHYGFVRAVDDVSLIVESGRFITLLGPSGSGKTTTMRMIAGLERPDAGVISIGDRVVSGRGNFVPTYKRRLGMVFQSYAVWPHKTVEENVAFPLQQRGVSRAEQKWLVQQMLERVGLGQHGGRYPSQLSGGQQQRVSLARALVAEPEVILFDEPLSNLDAQLRDSMRDLLAELLGPMGVTSVYVTHDQAEAMVLSDTIYVMKDGRVVQSGKPSDLYERPESTFVANFIGRANTFKIMDVDRAAGQVRLEGGQILRVSATERPVSENVLAIRPNRIRIAADSDSENVIGGTVRLVSYLGDLVRYVVETDTGGELTLDLASGRPVAARGDRLRVVLPPEACILI